MASHPSLRKYVYLAYDTACIIATLVLALYLRHGFPLIQEYSGPHDLRLLLCVTFITSLIILPIMRINRGMWRFTGTGDLAQIMLAVALVILITDSSLFLISRLEMMPRSVPPMHWALAVSALGGSRLLARRLLRKKVDRRAHPRATVKQHVLVIGVGHAAELYLQFIKRIVQHQVAVAGFVDPDPALTDRVFQKHRILGTVEALPQILGDFHVHGVEIRQVVLTGLFEELTETERAMLREMEEKGVIDLLHFGKQMNPQLEATAAEQMRDFYHVASGIAAQITERPRGIYPTIKRLIDLIGGIILLLVFSPLLLLTACAVAVDVGFPLLFWQRRPGLDGKPFHLYKFRTMKQAGWAMGEDRSKHKSGDTERTSILGKWLRRLRLDELPQLLHIIAGTMSFVGPRPLLPDDQPLGGEARLTVRPGVTGWAQIHGGDALSPEEKLMLDLWYIRHLSLWLDLRILLRTLIVVLKADMRRPYIIDMNAHDQQLQ